MTAREVALKVLYDVDEKGAFINEALKEALGENDLSPSDRGLVTELAYGVVSNKTAIDFIISKYSKIKLKKMTPWVRNILRMGVYQIYYMDKIPPSAACNEAVKLAKKHSHKAVWGFVNGVLRAFSRDAEGFSFPKSGDAAEDLSLEFSYPIWMTKKLLDEYGEEKCRALFCENTKAHGFFLRANSLKTSTCELMVVLKDEGIECEETDIKGCLKGKGRLSIDNSKAYGDGLFSIQNISSQRAVDALDPRPGFLVIDMCAAPGGKSCAVAERMRNQGKVISFDIYEHKIELIKKSAKRLGIDIIDARLGDGQKRIEELCGMADCVLADVPCSGLGVIHKKPDVKWKREEGDIEELCRIQREILWNAATYVKTGGTLVYSTCTILPEENRLMAEAFLESHSEFEKVFEEQYLTTDFGESGFYICKMMKR